MNGLLLKFSKIVFVSNWCCDWGLRRTVGLVAFITL